MKFTFKTEHPTGRYKSFHPRHHYIKMKGEVVGSISDGEGYVIRLQVVKKDINEDKNPNCKWRWITLKGEHETLNDAKIWINDHIKGILDKWELYMLPTEKEKL